MEPKDARQTYFLEMVRELKAKYYGTQEAFNVAREVKVYEQLLREFAESVDAEVRNGLNTDYTTEERVCALREMLKSAESPVRIKLSVRDDDEYKRLDEGRKLLCREKSWIRSLNKNKKLEL